MKLDDDLGERVRALDAYAVRTNLDAEQRLRAERSALRHVARARTRKRRWVAALSLAASFALAGAWAWRRVPASLPEVAREETLATRQQQRVQPPLEEGADDCGYTIPDRWQRRIQGDSALDLGERALVVSTPGSEVTLMQLAPCSVELALAKGSLSVHARRLNGGTLVVSTPGGSVTVRGTVFEVGFFPGRHELVVGVDEGLVEVAREDGTIWHVAAGQRLVVSEGRDAVQGLLGVAKDALRRRLGLPLFEVLDAQSHPGARAVSDAGTGRVQELRDAEARVWQAGSVAPPDLTPEPKTSLTDEGRPLQKPRVIPGETP